MSIKREFNAAERKSIAADWNDGATLRAIATRVHCASATVSLLIDEMRAEGVALRARDRYQAACATPAYSDADLADIARRFRAGEKQIAIARALDGSNTWVSRGRDLAIRRGLDVTPVPPAAKSQSAPSAALSKRKVAIRVIGDMPIALPYLRCLDPEASV